MRLSLLILALLICGCGSTPPILSTVLDSQTGTTHVQPLQPFSFVELRPGLAATGADIALVAPVAVSREGRQRQHLWIALGSTIDRELTGAAISTPKTVVLLADSQPMVLATEPWSDVSRFAAFVPKHPVRHTLGARVSASQLVQIAQARTLQVLIEDASGRVATYLPGDDIDTLRAALLAAGSANGAQANTKTAELRQKL